MRVWPVPDSFQKSIPESGQPGSFWENRGDRRHAGVDIYAPAGSPVVAIEGGLIQSIRPFTSPSAQPYWHPTLEILIKTNSGTFHRYAELEKTLVKQGEWIETGMKIGKVGSVLNPQGVSENSPDYVKNLIQAKHFSMLHFEMYTDIQSMDRSYSGGNYFVDAIPAGLGDPSRYLESTFQDDPGK